MNPQQFQNMAGMGRGMPNNMPHMNLAGQMGGHMGAQMAGQMGGQMGGMMPHQMGGGQMNNGPNPQVQHHILQALQAQGPFTGWQASVNIRERAGQIKLLVDSLRLVRPPVDPPRAIEVALQFERKCFTQSASKEDYIRECSEKLGRIRDQRAHQAAAGGMQGMQMPNQNFQQFQQLNQNMSQNMNVPPHLQQQMQGSPMFNQQRGPQPMMNQGQNSGNPAGMMQINNQQKPAPPFPELTPEDNKTINLRAAELAKSTPKEEMRNIVEKMNPQLRQNLAQKSVDPIIYYFRMLATKEFRRQKQMEARLGAGGNAGQANNAQSMMAQMQGQQPNPNMINQAMNPNTAQLMNDMGRFQGQQAEGLRSQEEGQLVVPASTPGGMTPDQLRMQQQMLANNQRMGQQNQNNTAFLAQQQRLQQAQANKMQQAAQMQAQSQQQARAQAAAQAQLGLGGGPPRPQMQGIPQSNTPLSMLNRPVSTNIQGASPQAGPRAASGNPMMGGQQQMGGQVQMTAQDMQKREQNLSRFPPPVQAILRQKPPHEWQSVLQQYQQDTAMRKSLSQQPQGMQGMQHMPQLQNGAFLGEANIGTIPMQQSLSAGAIPGQLGQEMNSMPGQEGPMQPNQELMRQRQMQMRQQQQQQQQMSGNQPNPMGAVPHPPPGRQLTQQQLAIMDQQPVPPNILAHVRQHARIPEIKNWFQLKQWARQNPSPNLPLAQLMSFQTSHFAHIMKSRGIPGQIVPQDNSSMVGQPSGPQQQPMPPGSRQGMPGQPAGLPLGQQPPLKGPSPQDIQRIRAANPKLQNVPDEQIRALLINRQKQLLHQQAMQQQGSQQGMGQPGMAQHPPFVPPHAGQVQGKQPGLQLPGQTPAPGPAQLQGQQPGRPPSAQAPGPRRPSQTSMQPDSKGLKRSSEDEVVEISHQAQAASKQPPAPPSKALPTLTKEQLAALDPQKRQQYISLQRQQAAMRKIVELSREMQNTMPKPRPIANLDPAIKKRITALLTTDNVKNMLERFDQFLIACYRMEQNDAVIKQLISQKLYLVHQYKPQSVTSRTFEPADNYSIGVEQLENIINNITAKFQQTAAQIPHQNRLRPPQQAQLTPENLSLLEAQEQERKKSIKAPPAPTSAQPPFPLGDARGQGAPRYAATGLKPEDLKLPTDAKRRRKNPPAAAQNTAAAPVPASTAASAPAAATSSTLTSPTAAKVTKPPAEMFKCAVGNCEHHTKGFATQAELDEHNNRAHKPEMEQVKDPLAFLHDSLRTAFNLDENFQQIKKEQEEGVQMQKTASKTSTAANIKMESKPVTPIPMVKVPSQGPALSKTPQIKEIEGVEKTQEVTDSWVHSNIGLDTLHDVFGDIEWTDVIPSYEDHLATPDKFITTYQKSEAWQKIVDGPNGVLTDTSTDKSVSPVIAGDKELPHARDADKARDAPKAQEEEFIVDLNGTDGLDVDDISMFDAVHEPDMAVFVPEDNGSSPFEVVEKPQTTLEESSLEFLGIDYKHSDTLTPDDQEVYDWVTAPNAVPADMVDKPWEDIDWDDHQQKGPEVWAAGTMEWNAIGPAAEQTRKELGWVKKGDGAAKV